MQEEDDQPIVEVDPTEGGLKTEGWMMGSGGDDSTDYEIPSEQFEQDMQAEDEQYIQAGNDALSGQQVESQTVPPHLIRKIEPVGLTGILYELWPQHQVQFSKINSDARLRMQQQNYIFIKYDALLVP